MKRPRSMFFVPSSVIHRRRVWPSSVDIAADGHAAEAHLQHGLPVSQWAGMLLISSSGGGGGGGGGYSWAAIFEVVNVVKVVVVVVDVVVVVVHRSVASKSCSARIE